MIDPVNLTLPHAFKPDDQERRFIEEYCVDLDHKAAATRIGVAPEKAGSFGRRMVNRSEIRELIDQRLQALEVVSISSAAWVRGQLTVVVQRCMQQVPVLKMQKNADGKYEQMETGEYAFNAQGAVKALELLGRHHGMFTDRVIITIEQELKDLSESELQARLDRLKEEARTLDLVPGADGVHAMPADPPKE